MTTSGFPEINLFLEYLRKSPNSQHSALPNAEKAFADLKANYGVAIHWGTFKLTTEQMDEPPERLIQSLTDQQISSEKFRVLMHGENWDEPLSEKM